MRADQTRQLQVSLLVLSVRRNPKPEEGSKASWCGRPPPTNDRIRRVSNGESFNFHTKCKERALGCVDGKVHTLILEVSWPVSKNQEGTDLQREGGTEGGKEGKSRN